MIQNKVILLLLFLVLAVVQGCAPSLSSHVRQELPELGINREIGFGIRTVAPTLAKYAVYPIQLGLGDYKAEFNGIKSDHLLRQIEDLESQGKLTGKCKEKLYYAAKQLANTGVIRIEEPFIVKIGAKGRIEEKGYKNVGIYLIPQDVETYIPDILVITVSPSHEVNIHCGAKFLLELLPGGGKEIVVDFDTLNYLQPALGSKLKLR